MNKLSEFLDFLDNRYVFRRVVFVFYALYLTPLVTYQAWEFAVTALSLKSTGMEIAAMVAAITAPFAAIAKFVIDMYSQARNK